MTQIFASQIDGRPESNVTVQLDGRVLGYASPTRALELAKLLRKLKTEQDRRVPLDMEIGHVPVSKGGQYPGLYLFSDRSRMMRPVTYLENDKRDHVGTFEQVYMDIACTKEEVEKGVSTHVELDPTSMLSVVANMTPYSDFNQSPRNMYQVCQSTRVKLTVSARWESRRWVHLRRPFPSGQTIKWYVPMRP
jgi:DNA-directed RNA polymerase I subunit RPA2